MDTILLSDAEFELEQAFQYYQSQRAGLGVEFIEEFRRGVENIIQFPLGWQEIDDGFRRYRIAPFPYAILYKYSAADQTIVIQNIVQLNRK